MPRRNPFGKRARPHVSPSEAGIKMFLMKPLPARASFPSLESSILISLACSGVHPYFSGAIHNSKQELGCKKKERRGEEEKRGTRIFLLCFLVVARSGGPRLCCIVGSCCDGLSPALRSCDGGGAPWDFFHRELHRSVGSQTGVFLPTCESSVTDLCWLFGGLPL